MNKKLLLTVAISMATTFTTLLAQQNHEKCATMSVLNTQIAKHPSILTRMQ